MIARISFAFLLLLSASLSQAADKYWTGAVNSSWSVAGNWSPAGAPGTGDRVILNNAGNVDLHINTSVTVAGWLQYDNYFETVYLNNGSELTVGSLGFFMDSGGFFGQGGLLDCNGACEIHGGGFQTPSAGLQVQGDLEVNPYPLGGWFEENGATFTLNGSQWTTLISNVTLPNLTVNKTFGYGVIIPEGMLLQVNGYTELLDGVINGAGEFRVNGDCRVGAGHDGGSGTFKMVGSGAHILNMEREKWPMALVEVNMNSPADTTRLVSVIAGYNAQALDDTLRIERGVLFIDYFDTFSFDQHSTFIEPEGTLLAPPSTLAVQGNWTNNGGTFEHNNGTVGFNTARHTTIAANGTETFHNLYLNKSFGYFLTIPAGDAVRVENRMDFYDGLLQGPGVLQIEDTLAIQSGHDLGTAGVEVVSDKVSNVIINNTTSFFNAFDIQKENSTDSVYFQTELAHMQTGVAGNRVDIHHGVMAFRDYGAYVDWNIPDTELHAGGTLVAPEGTLLASGNFVESGGTFKHNMGTWTWDNAVHRTLDVSDRIEFYNATINKHNSYSLDLADGDSLVAVNKITFSQGLIDNPLARIVALDSVVHTGGHIRGTASLTFMGAGDGHWIVNETGVLHHEVRIEKDNPSSVVWATSDNAELEVGDSSEDLFITRGTLAFEGIGTFVDLDYSDIFIEQYGTFRAWSGTTAFSGSLYEQGGSFEHNMGLWTVDTAVHRTLDVSDRIEFYDFRMNKNNSYILTVASGDSLVVLNKYLSSQGLINNPDARIIAMDSVVHTGGHIRGTAPLTFGGSNDGHWIINESSFLHNEVSVDKDNPEAIVWTTSDNTELELGESDETLTVETGILAFENIGSFVDMNYGSVVLNPGGTFRAWSGTTAFSGSLTEQGGSFEHNMGLWTVDTAVHRTLDVSDRIEFYDFRMNKNNSYILTVASGDSLVVLNKYLSSQGLINNPDARIIAMDSVVHTSGHIRGTAPLVFFGPEDGHWIVNETGALHSNIFIEKASPDVAVWTTSDNAELDMGSTDENLTVEEGILAFENVGTNVDYDFANTYLKSGGTFRAWSGTTVQLGSLYEQGGTFEHNMGNWIFDNASFRNLDVTDRIEFYNVSINKANGYALNIGAGDSLVALNKLTFVQGYLNNADARLVAMDSVYHSSSHLRGSAPLVFMGSTDGHWIVDETGVLHQDIRIEKEGPNQTVWTSTNLGNLEVGSSDESITIDQGRWAFSDVGNFVDMDFLNVTITTNGTLEAHAGDTYFYGNLYETGGTFDHNFGHWQFNTAVFTNLNVTDRIEFWDASINKSNGYALTVASGDSLVALNKYTSYQGYLNNTDARLVIEDSLLVTGSHLNGTCPLAFTGTKNGTWIHNETTSTFPVTRIEKSAGSKVDLYSEAANLLIGAASESLEVISGTLDIEQGAGIVDWNYGNTVFDGGTAVLHSGDTFWAGGLTFNSGTIDHPEGTVVIDTPVFVNWEFNAVPTFGNVTIAKNNGYAVNLTGAGTADVSGDITFSQGYSNGGLWRVAGNATVLSAWLGGSSGLEFNGTMDQDFDLTGASNKWNGLVRLNKPDGEVIVQSDLVFDDFSTQLDLQQGIINYADPVNHSVYFNAGQPGWTGGNSDSYVHGHASRSGVNNGWVPIGRNGKYAPAGVFNMVNANDVNRLEYFDFTPPAGAVVSNQFTTLDHIAQCEYWQLGHSGNTVNASVGITYDSDRCGPIDDAPALVLAAFNAANTEWTNQDSDTGDQGVLYSGLFNLGTFSAFTVGSENGNNPLDGSTAASCFGDTDGDGQVTTNDLLNIIGEYGCNVGCTHDLTGDGPVSSDDILALLGVFGTACP